MAFTIDPATELKRVFSARLASTIVGLTTGAKALSPGMKVRIAAALKKVASLLEKQAKQEIGLTERKRTAVDAGVRFALVPKSAEWVIDAAAAAQLLPIKTHPQAWRKSNSGGHVKTEVDALVE